MNRREAIRYTTWGAGIGLLTPGVLAVLQSCRSNPKNLEWSPVVLTEVLAIRLGRLSDILLPSTDSPSATQVHVPEFIDLLMADVLSPDQSQAVSSGLQSLGAVSQQNENEVFENLTGDKQVALVAAIDEHAFAARTSEEWDETFLEQYRYIKSLILTAYFTSEEGVKQNLHYLEIPGEFQACIDLPPDGRIVVGNHM